IGFETRIQDFAPAIILSAKVKELPFIVEMRQSNLTIPARADLTVVQGNSRTPRKKTHWDCVAHLPNPKIANNTERRRSDLDFKQSTILFPFRGNARNQSGGLQLVCSRKIFCLFGCRQTRLAYRHLSSLRPQQLNVSFRLRCENLHYVQNQ